MTYAAVAAAKSNRAQDGHGKLWTKRQAVPCPGSASGIPRIHSATFFSAYIRRYCRISALLSVVSVSGWVARRAPTRRALVRQGGRATRITFPPRHVV